jgi:DNA (cytosine-5)-methyltransferase 1
VLNKHWPDVPIIDDIKEYKYGDVANTESEGARRIFVKDEAQRPQSSNELFGERSTVLRNSKGDKTYDRPAIDLLTGGFPCQPFSVAGKQRGKNDDRYLWPEMFRVIQETQPSWIIGENVPGIINMGLEATALDLEKEGYEVELLVLPACGVGAWHQRQRVWIVAHSEHNGCDSRSDTSETGSNIKDGSSEENRQFGEEQGFRTGKGSADVANSNSRGRPPIKHTRGSEKEDSRGEKGAYGMSGQCSNISREQNWATEPAVGRVANGIPNRVDKLKGLGNAIVPQCVTPIMWAIKEIEKL